MIIWMVLTSACLGQILGDAAGKAGAHQPFDPVAAQAAEQGDEPRLVIMHAEEAKAEVGGHSRQVDIDQRERGLSVASKIFDDGVETVSLGTRTHDGARSTRPRR